MDNLAHALVGAALMRAEADRHVPRAALLGIVAANAPDLSELFIGLPGTRADFLVLHRGITHSLVGAVAEVVGLTLLIGLGWRVARWILSRRGRSVAVPAWNWLALGIAAAVLSHLYMDWQGSYGWRPFLPWSGTWYYLDWVAIVDPFFWLVPLVALAWGAERRFGAGASWAALTNVGRPFTWESIYASTDTVAGDDWRLSRHLGARQVQRAIAETRDGQAMAQFARFLAAEVDTSNATVYLWDA